MILRVVQDEWRLPTRGGGVEKWRSYSLIGIGHGAGAGGGALEGGALGCGDGAMSGDFYPDRGPTEAWCYDRDLPRDYFVLT